LITPEYFTLGINNEGFSATFEKILYASDYSSTGNHYLISKFVTTAPGNPITYESNQVVISKRPTFTLNPSSLSLSCGDVSQKQFVVNAQNIPAGVTPTYQWNYNFDWSGNNTNTNSILLAPISGTSLPSNVSVTPILNGVAQPTITCQVTRSGFDPNLSISGSNIGCPNSTSNYSIETFGNTVQWSVSNPSLATLNTTTGNNISLTPTGEGTLTLTATVFTACNQSKPFTKNRTILELALSLDYNLV
jgi:hypothetical protein